MIDFDELERLITLLEGASVNDITLRQGDSRLTLRKFHRAGAAAPQVAVSAHSEEDLMLFYDDDEGADPEQDAEPPLFTVTSNLVGVFRHLKPMVGMGSRVTANQAVGNIETMKLENEVRVECNGVVEELFVEDGMPVEYGQPLFAIRRDV